MMMHRSLCLLLLHLALCIHCYILHPDYSPGQSPRSRRNVNLPMLERDPMQNEDWSLDEERGFIRGLSEKRMERHVDAIFTNTYRKFLSQISARRYLQNMMGKRLGQDYLDRQDQGDSEQSPRILRDTIASVLIGL
ncbi:PREDICTED: somatoliberin [Nanorana parkeri]|uniref:somatoliberin n=1 Tax=Nanorana parkeri TaxID=125878 RepID=UPI00085494AC|nr:PREDICTED: somatoliberin [Nanorana parkeri]